MKSKFSQNYFTNSSQERSAVLLLAAILLIITAIYIYIHWHPPIPPFTIESIRSQVPFEDTISMSENSSIPVATISRLYPFNPNDVTQDELISFGIPVKTASTWTHFLVKNGKFKHKEDVLKIYGMNERLYNIISPFIQLDQKNENRKAENVILEMKPISAIDPNTADYAALIQAGLSGKLANTLIHYRSSGKVFRSVSDLAKLYGMNDSLLGKIRPYLLFPNVVATPAAIEQNTSSTVQTTPEEIVRSSIDINKADSAVLKRLPGIGHVLALRIISYREKLGGYYSVDQLKEVYGLQDSVLSAFRSQLTVETPYRKIKINTDSLPKMYHPYLTKKDAVLIQSYRDQHGSFQSIQDLYLMKAFDQKYWDRLYPYIDFGINGNK